MPTNTYVELKKTTLATNTATVEITSIPQGYTDLVLVINAGNASGSGSAIRSRINDDSGSNYSTTYLDANGSNVVSARDSNNTTIPFGWRVSAGSSIDTSIVVHYMNYADTTRYKNVLMRTNNASQGTNLNNALWRSTSAINKLSFVIGGFGASTGDFLAGSTFSLYGIKAEGISPAPKATGGVIYSDDTYYYHAFGASGTFTPSQSLTADILCVAGGGGGGTANRGGGGGAGGVIYFASQSLTTTGYSCTVGAGGSQFGQGNNSQFASLTVASGGGRGGASNFGGAYLATAGGSGGGNGNDGTNNGGASNQSSSGATAIYGNRGGNVTVGGDVAGGGGAGAAGTDGINSNDGIAGGIGTTAFTSWSSATGIGQFSNNAYYIAAGGAGGANYSGYGALYTSRTLGGGGFNSTSLYECSGLANTGSGGAGFSYNSGSNTYPAGYGGSGFIIVRYAK